MRSRWLGFVLAGLAGVVSAVIWNRLPPEVTTHWSMEGVPDGYSSRLTTALFGPLAIIGLTLIMQVLPFIDPKRENYAKFRDVFNLLINVVALFILVLHVAILANAAGAPVNVMKVIGTSAGALMILLGNYLGRVKPNWFVGIRTPWTLSSPEVWRKTHRVGGWLFVLAGVVTTVATWLPGMHGMYAALVAIMVAAVGSALLSLVLWMQEKKEKESKGEREKA